MRNGNLLYILLILANRESLFCQSKVTFDTTFLKINEIKEVKSYNTNNNERVFIRLDTINNLKEELTYKRGRFHFKNVWKNGVTIVKNGNGNYESYFSNGTIHSKGEIYQGEKKDTWTYYYPNKQISAIVDYKYCYDCFCCNPYNLENGNLLISYDLDGKTIGENGKGQILKLLKNGEILEKNFLSKNITDSLYHFENNNLSKVYIRLINSYINLTRQYFPNGQLELLTEKNGDTILNTTYFINGELEGVEKQFDSTTFYTKYSIKGRKVEEALYIRGETPNEIGWDIWQRDIYIRKWDEEGNQIK